MPQPPPRNDRAVADYRHLWVPELAVWVLVAAAATPVFWFTELDLDAARWFFHPGQADPWPEGDSPLWQWLYYSAPMLAGVTAAASLLVLAGALLARRFSRLQPYALFVLLVVLLGPGLLVNGVFKEHWDRPRPRQVEQLGGHANYSPPLAIGEYDAGKSFPAGHSSVAFSLIAFWFIWRRRRRWLAGLALAASLTLGTLYGLGRMAAGAHFLSDVLWSALLPAGVALVLYHFVLRIPAREDRATQPPRGAASGRARWLAFAYAAAGGAVLVGVLLATPFDHRWAYALEPPVEQFRLAADEARISLELSPAAPATVAIDGDANGFGLPGNRLRVETHESAQGVDYRLWHSGVFTEIESRVTIHVNPTRLRRFVLDLQRGDVEVRGRAWRDALDLDLSSATGRVSWRD